MNDDPPRFGSRKSSRAGGVGPPSTSDRPAHSTEIPVVQLVRPPRSPATPESAPAPQVSAPEPETNDQALAPPRSPRPEHETRGTAAYYGEPVADDVNGPAPPEPTPGEPVPHVTTTPGLSAHEAVPGGAPPHVTTAPGLSAHEAVPGGAPPHVTTTPGLATQGPGPDAAPAGGPLAAEPSADLAETLRPPTEEPPPPEDEFDDLQETSVKRRSSRIALPLPPPLADGSWTGPPGADDASQAVRPIAELVSDYLLQEMGSPSIGPPDPDLAAGAGPAPAIVQAPQAEDVVGGRYRIEVPLGEGGMGKVLRVRHLQLGKCFALKLIQMGQSMQAKARDAFYREARLASSLQHPNIVSIVDYGEDARLGAFMVMELLEGQTLTLQLYAKGRLTIKPVCDIIMQIAEALHYIHDRQIIHCDIKPDNIFVCKLPTTERRKWTVKLIDFGMARVGASSSRTTQSIEGTPAYMAPERIQGQAPQPSMDIYSLGVLAYELLTGKLPFDGTIYEIMTAHCNDTPPPPSERLSEHMDERAEALIMRALAKDPADRQKDMSAFIYELKTLMEMLGMGRRRAVPAPRRAHQEAPGPRERGMMTGFEVAPIPLAGIDGSGTIVVANRAFAHFLTGSRDAVLEGKKLYDTELAALHPRLRKDLGKVLRDGSRTNTVLTLGAADGKPLRLVLWIVPGNDDGAAAYVAIHGLDTPRQRNSGG